MLERFLEIAGIVVLVYFILLNLLYIVFTVIAWMGLNDYLRRRTYESTAEAFASPLTPGISVLLPAYNEEAGVVESVRSLLALRYPAHEVVVINDGSTDRTIEVLKEEFDLVPATRAIRDEIASAPIKQVYLSRRSRKLCVVDKENGGKADALNCGINVSRQPYFCAIDADAIIETEALLRVAQPLLDDPAAVVATGGIVRIVNGCVVDHGRVLEVKRPKSRLASFQVVEYFRAFLVGRMGWTRLNALLIISGAFGLFKRSVVEEVGGYWTDTVGEDVELVVRIHRHMRDNKERYRIMFVPDPVCWTECPEDLRTLSRQRRRWHRGLLQTLGRHRRVSFNPRYGALGTLAFPYFIIFEALGPVIEVLGYIVIPIAAFLGLLSMSYLIAFIGLAIVLGIVLSVGALTLEEFSFRRHARGRDVVWLFVYAVLENFGFRQLTALWRVMGFVDVARKKTTWGTMTRRGLVREES